MFTSLKGYRTYIVAIATAVYAILGLLLHQLDWPQAIALLQLSGMGAGIRAAL